MFDRQPTSLREGKPEEPIFRFLPHYRNLIFYPRSLHPFFFFVTFLIVPDEGKKETNGN
ncbi:Uncharacterized protein APZ42_017782 [Daphnia magna]|uniref:Uncharacterized protein n=1 Tax=Daphnia magna TaxID=35525 RepID=A0A164ZL10_9CRUS|nr:Uncharacterized protein APZ42_017782 [Daphnia magna]